MSEYGSTTVFGQTLNFITTIKLREVERQRTAFSKHVEQVLSDASVSASPLDRVSILIKGIKAWPGLTGASSSTHSLENIERWITQARNDPSIASIQIEEWTTTLETQLRHAVTRYDYAKLFGNLLTEWLDSSDSQATGLVSDKSVDEMSVGEAKPAREEKTIERDKIKELIFEAKSIDTSAIEEYLSELFSSSDAAAALTAVREKLVQSDRELKAYRIDADDLNWLIKTLLSRDLLSSEKAATLKGFLGNEVILAEVASVLNMQLDSLDAWAWPEEGVYVEMRRHLSGKYRAYMDNEIITALLFQYVGMKWSVSFKSAFRALVDSRAWKREASESLLDRRQLQRRHEYLGESPASFRSSIEASRRQLQSEHFFMTQLPGELDAEDQYDSEPRPGDDKNASANHAQQIMLRLVSTEAHLQRALHGEFTIMRADLEWFGPSLPHDSVLTVLKFFGMPDRWISFFKTWLSASLRFDKDGPVQIRKRGVPIAHCLSVLCGEAVLFGMDFAVNQKTGLYMYRIYDDFWFWHHDSRKCAEAWDAMQRYASMIGISFNMKKTGGACVGGTLDPSLPKGSVAWGLLEFDATEGRFVVSNEGVDKHISEMRHQLAVTKSVFGYINAYNQYLGFMRRQFGESAHCFGRAHGDEIVRCLERIQTELFPETTGSVVEELRKMIHERFGVHDVPFGWFYFPINRGGLEVHNPIVDHLVLRDNVEESPEKLFVKELEKDKQRYIACLDLWKTTAASRPAGASRNDTEQFMPFEEYILGRETHLMAWGQTYRELLELPSSSVISLPAKVSAEAGISYNTSPYDRWIAALYAEEVFKRFGSLTIVESSLIPVGMVSVFKNTRVTWDS